MSEYFLKSKAIGGKVKVELDLSKYATTTTKILKVQQELIHHLLENRLISLI